jgi:hypothetical protein
MSKVTDSLVNSEALAAGLGTDGATITDSALSVLGAIGANNNNNAFSSATVVSNADGSVLEREEFIQTKIAEIKAIAGALTDTADHTVSTATVMKLLRWLDQNIGALTDVADETASTATMLNQLRALLSRQIPRIARKAVTFSALTTGATGSHVIFTVTGAVKVKMYAVCAADLVPDVAGATISVGIVGTAQAFIATTTAADIDAGELWFAAAPATKFDTDANAGIAKKAIGDGTDIDYVVATQAIQSGVINFMCEWEPISPDGNVVAA